MVIPRQEFRVPAYLNASWLTYNYVLEHAFVPEIPRRLEDFAGNTMGYKNTLFGIMPCLSQTEVRAGDVIIFDSYEEKRTAEGYENDRFCTITEQDIQDYLDRKRDLLPAGVIVHPPKQAQ